MINDRYDLKTKNYESSASQSSFFVYIKYFSLNLRILPHSFLKILYVGCKLLWENYIKIYAICQAFHALIFFYWNKWYVCNFYIKKPDKVGVEFCLRKSLAIHGCGY